MFQQKSPGLNSKFDPKWSNCPTQSDEGIISTERNLNREAHLWYAITSPENMDRAHKHLQDAFDLLMRCVQANSFISDYPPVPYWGGRMEALLQNYANARALLENGEYGEMIGWNGQLQDIQRGFEEGNMSWMSSSADTFMEELGRAYSICSRFNFALTMSQHFFKIRNRCQRRGLARLLPNR